MSALCSWTHPVPRRARRPSISRSLLAFGILFLMACGDTAPDTTDQTDLQHSSTPSGEDDAQDEFAEAFGAGKGGGTLNFDGVSYSIESAVCHLDPPVEAGTVGEGYRVLIEGAQRPRASILGPDSVHWTHVDWQTVNFTVDGSVITGPATRYRNNRDDKVVEASFEIECP